MSLGIISDIHGNLDALEAIIEVFKEKRIDMIFCLGDMIGYFHQSIEVIERIRELKIPSLCGNHEAFLSGTLTYPSEREGIYNLNYVKRSLSRDDCQWLTSLPKSYEIVIDTKKFLFFHGSPWDPLQGYIYPDNPELWKFSTINSDYVFLGHTHHPLLTTVGSTVIVNPGSVGLPRNGDVRAHAAVFDEKTGIEFIRAEYDIGAFLESASAHGVDRITIERLKNPSNQHSLVRERKTRPL